MQNGNTPLKEYSHSSFYPRKPESYDAKAGILARPNVDVFPPALRPTVTNVVQLSHVR